MCKLNITEERINNHSSEEITWNETQIYINLNYEEVRRHGKQHDKVQDTFTKKSFHGMEIKRI